MKILHLEDNLRDAELIHAAIRAEWPACEIKTVATRFAFVGELQLGRFDLILSDFTLGGFSGLEALKLAKERVPDTPFIFLSGTIGEDCAIEALQSGAQDYVLKDRMKRLVAAIQRARREAEERTQRRQAERQIHEQAAMLNQARDAIVITDLEHRILYWNAGAERLFGWPTSEAMGKTAAQLITNADTLVQIRQASETTYAKGEWQGELHLVNRQGEPIVVESRQTLIRDEAGQTKARLSISTDITERKRLEEQFLRAQRMENIGLLAAGIAHDLNNMLAPVLMAAPLLRDLVANPDALKLVDLLERSAERGAALVRQILAFSHGANGGNRRIPVNLLLQDIAAVTASTFPKKIKFEDFIPNDLWSIHANPTQIHQVILNLCVNARDAMPEGGVLRLRAENCVLDAAAARVIEGGRAGAFVVLHVEDNGTGIAPEVVEHIWEPFFTTKGAHQGTGLGLSTVLGIVKNHGGFITLRTAVGRGATFRVYLPAAEHPAGDPALVAFRAAPRGNGELILIVDDEQPIRELIDHLLTRQGYRTVSASDGVEAAGIFGQQASEIRLVISDLQMPNLNGMLLARVLQRIDPTVRILIVSGMAAATGERPSIRPAEFSSAMISKPFVPEVLLNKVHELLHSAAKH